MFEKLALGGSVSEFKRRELMMLGRDVVQIEGCILLSCLDIGVPHELLKGTKVTASHEVIFAEGVADAVSAELGA